MWKGKITIVTENAVYFKKKTLAEEGQSILIQQSEPSLRTILFDVGRRSSTLRNNLEALGVPLNSIDTIVLSHGHAGHVGALADSLPFMKFPQVITHSGIFLQKAKRDKNGSLSLVHLLDQQRETIGRLAKIVETDLPLQVTECIWTSGQIPILNKVELGRNEGARYWIKKGDEFQLDEFVEENAIIIKSEVGLIVITACGHRGVPNTIELARSRFANEPIALVIGGFHLIQRPETTATVIERLQKLDVQRIMPSHCTGIMGKHQMALGLGKRVRFASTGTEVEIGTDITIRD